MSTSRAIIGRKIKQLRKNKKLSQQGLADLLDFDRQYAWKLERGQKNITTDYLDFIIKKLEAQHNDFLIADSNN